MIHRAKRRATTPARYYYIVITLLIKAAARSQTRSRLAWQKHGEEAHEINIPPSNLVNNWLSISVKEHLPLNLTVTDLTKSPAVYEREKQKFT